MPGVTEETYFEATGTPKISQYLIIETNSESVNFKYRNTGSLEGYTVNDKPTEYNLKIF